MLRPIQHDRDVQEIEFGKLVGETFEIFDESGRRLGVASRAEAHRKGLWHRASNVFVFCLDGKLVIQQRQFSKDVCPGAWDVSAAEHLKPGETFEQGALRGLKEELGIEGVTVQPFGGVTKYRLEIAASSVKDYEFQQSFRVVYDGCIYPDASEVLATRTIGLGELEAEMQQQPDAFTPWFRQRAMDLGLFASAA